MGREVRRVPMGWDFPRNERGHLEPHFDQSFEEASAEWIREFDAWRRGDRPHYFRPEKYPSDYQFWEWHGQPPEDRSCYRPHWTDEQRDGWVLYENVTEGTPVTPIFASAEELIEHLVHVGETIDRHRAGRAYARLVAQALVEMGSAPSFIFSPERGLQTGPEALADDREAKS